MLRLLAVVVALYALYLLAACGVARKLIFPGPGLPVPSELPDDVETISVEHDDGRTVGLYLPPAGPGSDPGPAVMFFHGNGEAADFWIDEMRWLTEAGFGVFLFEYRGYGRSNGAPSEKGLVADAVAFFDQLASRPEVDPERVVVHGRSLGAGAAMGLTRQRPAAAVILQSTFTSLADPARRFFVPGWALPDHFDNERALAAYEGPSLILHGEQDELLPVENAHRLKAAARDARLQLFDCGHNDCPPAAMRPAIRAFLEETGLWARPAYEDPPSLD